MRFRWTIKELDKVTDDKLIDTLIVERRSTINMGCPLDNRLGKLRANRERQELTPNLLSICKDVVFLENTTISKGQILMLIARAKAALTRVPN